MRVSEGERMKRIIIILISTFFLMSLITGEALIGKKKGLGIIGVPQKSGSIVLGFSQLGDESDWRTANSQSIIKAAKESGIELLFSNAQQKQENQIMAIRSFIEQQVDIIAFSPIVETGWDSVLKEAKIAGIPVIILDRNIKIADKSLYVTFIGSDFQEEGRMAGSWLVKDSKGLKGNINVAEIAGTEGSAPAIGREQGFVEMIRKNPRIKIVQRVSGDFMKSKGREAMRKILSDHGKDINYIYSHNDDMALGAVSAIEEYGLKPGKDIKVVSVDAVKAAFNAMIQGKINCTVECNPLLGPILMKTVKDITNGKRVPDRIIIKDGVYTQENAQKIIVNRKY